MTPRCGDRRDLKRPQGHGTKHPIEVWGEPRIEDLAQAIVIQGSAFQSRLEKRAHPPLFEPGAHLIESMMPVQHRQNPGFHAPTTREHVRGVWREHAGNDAGNLYLAEHAQDQGQVGHRTDLMHRDRHAASPLHISTTGCIIANMSMRA